MSPTRVQRRRVSGWRTPECSCGCGEGARYVGRGSRWENPWRVSRTPGAVDMWRVTDGRTVVYRPSETRAQQAAAEWFRVGLSPDDIAAMRALRGHDLMCWCPTRTCSSRWRTGEWGSCVCAAPVPMMGSDIPDVERWT